MKSCQLWVGPLTANGSAVQGALPSGSYSLADSWVLEVSVVGKGKMEYRPYGKSQWENCKAGPWILWSGPAIGNRELHPFRGTISGMLLSSGRDSIPGGNLKLPIVSWVLLDASSHKVRWAWQQSIRRWKCYLWD